MPKFKLDDHEIVKVGWADKSEYTWLAVGVKGVTKITHREQYCGDIGSIHWLEAWSNKQLISRFNAANVDQIVYDKEWT